MGSNNMMISHYAAYIEQAQVVTSALILLTSFVFLAQTRINGLITTFVWQSIFLVIATLAQAILTARFELYISAFLTLALKVLFIPYLMRYFVIKLNIRHKVAVIAHPFLLLIGAVVLVLFCYHLLAPVFASSKSMINHVTAVALAVTLLGMLLLITHRKAVSHIIGFMSMENGIFFAALVSTKGMPMAVELGIAFDVLIAAILFGVFFFHISSSIDSLDVDRLNLLREDIQ
jgi:hydrogenase-4 component E